MLKFQFKRLKNLKNFFKNRRFNKKLGSKLLLSLTLLQLIIFPSTSSAAEGFTPPHKPSSSGSKSRNFFGDQNNRPIDKKGDSRGSSGDSGGSSGGKKGGNSGGNGEYSPSEYSTAKAKEDVTNLSKRIDGVLNDPTKKKQNEEEVCEIDNENIRPTQKDILKALRDLKSDGGGFFDSQVGGIPIRLAVDADDYYGMLQQKLINKVYVELRKTEDDIPRVAENLGVSVDDARKVKNHLFHNVYNLADNDSRKNKRFDPGFNEGTAWLRLKENQMIEGDKTWFEHELIEQTLMNRKNNPLSYEDAHNAAETIHGKLGAPWTDLIKDPDIGNF